MLNNILLQSNLLTSGQFEIREPGKPTVFLFTELTGASLLKDAYNVLVQNVNWDSAPEFCKVLFCQMLPFNELFTYKGYGITTTHFITDITISFNMRDKFISIFFGSSGAPEWAGTFERFVREFENSEGNKIRL